MSKPCFFQQRFMQHSEYETLEMLSPGADDNTKKEEEKKRGKTNFEDPDERLTHFRCKVKTVSLYFVFFLVILQYLSSWQFASMVMSLN